MPCIRAGKDAVCWVDGHGKTSPVESIVSDARTQHSTLTQCVVVNLNLSLAYAFLATSAKMLS